jgi:hypothetical protein
MAERSGRRGWMLVVGALALVGLLATAAVLWIAAGDRGADNVAGFARAPMGCDTTLGFEGDRHLRAVRRDERRTRSTRRRL